MTTMVAAGDKPTDDQRAELMKRAMADANKPRTLPARDGGGVLSGRSLLTLWGHGRMTFMVGAGAATSSRPTAEQRAQLAAMAQAGMARQQASRPSDEDKRRLLEQAMGHK